MVGIISTAPPTATAKKDNTVNKVGILSNQVCAPSPFLRAEVIFTNAGASASSLATKCPRRTVLNTLITIKIPPVRYNAPPNALIGYNQSFKIVTVCKKLPYFKVPSSLNCCHIKPCVQPATYIGITQNKIPKVPI